IHRTRNILEYLVQERTDNKATMDYFAELIHAGNSDRVTMMLYGLPAWSSQYFLPTLDAMERNPSFVTVSMANNFIWKGAGWPQDAQIGSRLVKALDARFHFASVPSPQSYRGEFAQAVTLLGDIKSEESEAKLTPLLDDCSLITAGLDYSSKGDYPLIAI